MSKILPLLLLLALAACGPNGSSTSEDAGESQEAGEVLDAGADAGGGGSGGGAGGGSGGGSGGGAGGDAGVDGGSCPRSAATRTADIALLDQARVDIQSASNANQRATIVQSFAAAVAQNGGTPLQQSDGGTRVAFIAIGDPQFSYSVAGEFNSWTSGQNTLTRVGQSDLFAAEVTLSRDRGYAYKMVDGTSFYEDRRAQQVVWDGINRNTVGEFNALVYSEKQDPTRGRLVAWRGWHSTQLNDDRDVFIYLPATYEQAPCATLPSLYFHDGNESLTRSPFHFKADDHFKNNPTESAVLVFVALPSQNQRLAEYTFSSGTAPRGDAYLNALKTELVPQISAKFRVCATAADRGLSGASLGGLISARGAFNHPDTFGYVGSQSGSFFWNNAELVTRAGATPVVPVRWYVDHGCPDDNCVSNRDLVNALNGRGYSVVHTEEANGQHDWSYWQRRLPQLFSTFRTGRTGCGP